MPYILKRIGNRYKVCKEDEPATCFSKKPLSKEQAIKQKTAIIINETQGGSSSIPTDPKLYDRVKQEIYAKNPKHSLYRSAQIVKEYKRRGGEYKNPKKKDSGIDKWMDENWVSANDYIRGDIEKCGNNNARDYNEYPLCFPLDRIKKFTKNELEDLIKEKTKLKEKHIQTKQLTGKGGQSPPQSSPQKELYKLYRSDVKNKKWDMYYEDGDKIKKVSFGHPDYQDYTQHHDKERRKAYLERASNIKGDWKDNPFSSNNMAIHILWGKYTDINKNLNAYLKKIKIKI